MRWLKKSERSPEGGDTRVRRAFAWKPLQINRFVVWLEFYEVHERFFQPRGGAPGWWSETSKELCCWYY